MEIKRQSIHNSQFTIRRVEINNSQFSIALHRKVITSVQKVITWVIICIQKVIIRIPKALNYYAFKNPYHAVPPAKPQFKNPKTIQQAPALYALLDLLSLNVNKVWISAFHLLKQQKNSQKIICKRVDFVRGSKRVFRKVVSGAPLVYVCVSAARHQSASVRPRPSASFINSEKSVRSKSQILTPPQTNPTPTSQIPNSISTQITIPNSQSLAVA